MNTNKITTLEMECAIAKWFNPRINLVVPNISWGFFIHECDLIVLTKSGYLYEVEIKTRMSDLVKDSKKYHRHTSLKIRHLYFALPKYIFTGRALDIIPKDAGILTVDNPDTVTVERKPELWYRDLGDWDGNHGGRNEYKVSAEEKYQIARLGALRIWNLKEKLLKAKENERKS